MQPDQPTPAEPAIERLRKLAYGAVSAAPVESLQFVSERMAVAVEVVDAFAPELDAAYQRGLAGAEKRFASMIAEAVGVVVPGAHTPASVVSLPVVAGMLAGALRDARERGLAEAVDVVRAQAGLPDLVHFDRPSDFRKGVLTCLAALQANADAEEADRA